MTTSGGHFTRSKAVKANLSNPNESGNRYDLFLLLFGLHSVFFAFFMVPNVLLRLILTHRPWCTFQRTQRHHNTFRGLGIHRATCFTLAEEVYLLCLAIGPLLLQHFGVLLFPIPVSTVEMMPFRRLPPSSLIVPPSYNLSDTFCLSNTRDLECWIDRIEPPAFFGGCPVCIFLLLEWKWRYFDTFHLLLWPSNHPITCRTHCLYVRKAIVSVGSTTSSLHRLLENVLFVLFGLMFWCIPLTTVAPQRDRMLLVLTVLHFLLIFY